MTPLLSLLVFFSATTSAIAASIKTCIVPHGDGKTDDSPAILKVFKDCSTNSKITFSSGVKYNAWSTMKWGNLKNVVIELNGSLHLPNNIADVQAKVKKNTNGGKGWIYIDGTNVSLLGPNTDDKYAGAFYGYGQQWWDVVQKTDRPRVFVFHVTNGLVTNIKLIKPIAWGISISGANTLVRNTYIDAYPANGSKKTGKGFPSNTDGIGIIGTNITIDGYNGNNGDDCIAITSGARDVVAKNGYCGFASHGLSIGSLGQDGDTASVSNILFQNWTMDNSVYAARFKSWTGGKGKAENITWKNIKAINVTTGIFVTQNYFDNQKGPRPDNPSEFSTEVNNFHFEDISGSLAPDNTDSIVFDLFEGSVSKLTFKNINIRPYKGSATVACDPSVFDDEDLANLGFECHDGLYAATS